MITHLKKLTDYVDAWLSNLPHPVKRVIWGFHARVRDVYFMQHGREMGLVHDLAKHGLLPKFGGPGVDDQEAASWLLAGAYTDDLETEFFGKVVARVPDWLVERERPQGHFEVAVSDVFRCKGWAAEYEQALLRNSVVMIWSAFEALAGDLWVKTIRNVPDPLFDNALLKLKPAVSQELRACTGLPRESGLLRHFRMKSPEQFRKAYEAAWRHLPISTFTFFDNRSLRTLEHTRHLIVHRGGVVDGPFQTSTGSTAPLDELLALNPIATATMVGECIDVALKLIDFVRGWCLEVESWRQTPLP